MFTSAGLIGVVVTIAALQVPVVSAAGHCGMSYAFPRHDN
jgi:hypothetical protein